MLARLKEMREKENWNLFRWPTARRHKKQITII